MPNTEQLWVHKPLYTQGKTQPQNRLAIHPDTRHTTREQPRRGIGGIESGYPTLDAALKGNGWPRGAMTEILMDQSDNGELALLLPALAAITQSGQMVTLVNPPFIPHAPTLAAAGIRLEKLLILHPRSQRDELWAMEQTLQSGCCGALLSWQSGRQAADRDLRRLQQAARDGHCAHFYFRPSSCAQSPAALRLRLAVDDEQLHVQLLKRHGGPAGQRLRLPLSAGLSHRQRQLH
ncbi:hypothetical protein Maes01_02706 [Microbulbifer aestuariivivens]|uniref:Translesion DNA synthesis-associated protein ImuA n=1 Tax=Microbulbifer aestuariivivens TaxID=1908308 RepID=A0ABP9WSD3_9GAMM